MISIDKSTDIEKNYKNMVAVVKSFLDDETDLIANLSNISAVINSYMSDLNWAGFYLLKENGELVLGPFQGNPACIRIPAGKGVCQAAVSTRDTVLVPDVEAFPGHIACDSATKSELVAPVFKGDHVFAVIDLDSPNLDRFGDLESTYIKQIADLISDFLNKGNNVAW